jgi:hypothetical protein
MKRLAAVISVVAMSLMLTAMSALGAEEKKGEYGQQGQKDECLLFAKNCENEMDTIHQRIDRLNREISKGTDVYTYEELGTLNDQLHELMDVLMKDRPAS